MVDKIMLDVPYVQQARSNSCWYAALNMVQWYFEVGPRRGLPQAWIANQGLSPAQIHQLAREEGLRPVEGLADPIDMASLTEVLRRDGPIFAPGEYLSQRHVIVLVGTDDLGEEQAIYHDPASYDGQAMTFDDLNANGHRHLFYVKDLG